MGIYSSGSQPQAHWFVKTFIKFLRSLHCINESGKEYSSTWFQVQLDWLETYNTYNVHGQKHPIIIVKLFAIIAVCFRYIVPPLKNHWGTGRLRSECGISYLPSSQAWGVLQELTDMRGAEEELACSRQLLNDPLEQRQVPMKPKIQPGKCWLARFFCHVMCMKY